MENTDPISAQELYRLARRAASRGEYRAALADLTQALETDPAFRPAYRLAADCLAHENRADIAKLLEQAHNSFHSASRFFDIGYRLIDDEHYRPAIPFLMRALELDPYFVDAATELSVAFLATGRASEARRALENFDLENHFWAAYQLQWARALTGAAEDVQAFIDFHREELSGNRARRHRVDGNTQQKCLECLAELEECLRRLRALSHSANTVRDWHFVQYGTVLLGGPGMDGDTVGRLTEFCPNTDAVRTMLERLHAYLEQMALRPARIVSMPSRDARILAAALAIILEVAVVEADLENCEQPDVLIVAAHHVELASRALSRIRRGQTLFAGNIDWSRNALVCPDVAGYVCERLHYPWTAITADGDNGGKRTADERPPEIVGAELAATKPLDDPEAAGIMRYYTKIEPHLKGHNSGGSRRGAFMTDTPIIPPDRRGRPDDLSALVH